MALPDTGTPQAPVPAQDPPAVKPCTCTITSETVAVSPPDRTRTKIGVGERVTLTVSGGSATWSVGAGGTLLTTTGSSVVFAAGDQKASVVVTATTSACACSITFQVIPPTSFLMEPVSKKRKHSRGRPDCGFKANMFLLPSDVSFQWIQVRELDDPCVGKGFYLKLDGRTHRKPPGPSAAADVGPVGRGGTPARVNLVDEVYSGDSGEPVSAGTLVCPSRWEYTLKSVTSWQPIPAGQQVAEVKASGVCTLKKAGAEGKTKLSDDDSDY